VGEGLTLIDRCVMGHHARVIIPDELGSGTAPG
jgi:hypothetical protein